MANTSEITKDNLDTADISITHSCEFCSEEIEFTIDRMSDTDPMDQFAEHLKDEGWEILDSDKEGFIGLACPVCIKEEDEY